LKVLATEEYVKAGFDRINKGLGPESYTEEVVSIHAHSGIRAEEVGILNVLRIAGLTE
jgi:hypothetical protein